MVAAAVGFAPMEAYLTGYSQSSVDLTEVENADVERAESIGIPIAFIVLVVAVGAVVGGLMPLLTALASLTFTMGVLSALIVFRPMDSFLLSHRHDDRRRHLDRLLAVHPEPLPGGARARPGRGTADPWRPRSAWR